MQRSFFLTDLMKTGSHELYERFLNTHSLPNQTIECTGEYYTLHTYDLDKYDRKFALINRSGANGFRLKGNSEFTSELERRIQLLHSQGFKFILTTPWESQENVDGDLLMYPKNVHGVNCFSWTGGTSWFWWYMYDKHLNKVFRFNHDKKKYDFLYLNKQPREHRVRLYNKLLSENVLSNSVYTFLGLTPPVRLKKEHELPWVDANNYPQYGMDQDIHESPYNDTVYSLVSETNDNDTDVFMTEKIWKPIIAQHVFIVHGNHLYLQKLRDMGFKTFNTYFDESYDLKDDRDKKIDAIVNLCKDRKHRDWKDLYLQTIALRQHNYDTFFNKEKLSAEVNKVLVSFLEFFDNSQVSS